MKELILLTTILSTSLCAATLDLSPKEIQEIKKQPQGQMAFNRFEALKKVKNQAKTKSTMQKIVDINLFFNQTMPMYDNEKYSFDDYWATRKEFLISGKGDCEDYAIAKYFTLLELGIPKNRLYFSVVKVKNATNYHMILLYKDEKTNSLLVMDNLSFRILPLEKRVDLIPIAAFNEFETREIKDAQLGKKIKINWGKEDKWQEFLSRAYR